MNRKNSKKAKRNKLSLRRESIRVLTSSELSGAAGGRDLDGRKEVSNFGCYAESEAPTCICFTGNVFTAVCNGN